MDRTPPLLLKDPPLVCVVRVAAAPCTGLCRMMAREPDWGPQEDRGQGRDSAAVVAAEGVPVIYVQRIFAGPAQEAY